ncbi:hypothetical protein EDB81DRAFT_10162 [Dactylonectria macrodidyma]|uniref:Mid2 domain-containing protein n=1 Tax=Dactylonectria macrodidyma TaxID=307937 RepID=A0A9P9JI38_9HYPO|nr:hypothetical protein EDB81DRAFT_10162 [Dactylonectria macrodidyma]
MYASHLFKLLLVALSVICVAQASLIDFSGNHRQIIRRQSPGTNDDSTTDAATTATQADSSTSAAPTDQVSTTEQSATTQPATTSDVQTTAETPAPETTSAPAETTARDSSKSTSVPAQQTTEDSSSSKVAPTTSSGDAPAESTTAGDNTSTSEPPQTTSSGSQSDDNDKSTTDSSEDQTTESLVTSTHVDVVTKTNDDGSKEVMTSITITTSTPGLNSDDSNSSSGMSTKTRNTVIGVVVGIGGFIILGALGLVAWRIRGRKKQAEEADGLMDFGNNSSTAYHSGYNPVEKSEPSSAGRDSGPRTSPFQTNLDNYHQPTAPVNASSNF